MYALLEATVSGTGASSKSWEGIDSEGLGRGKKAKYPVAGGAGAGQDERMQE